MRVGPRGSIAVRQGRTSCRSSSNRSAITSDELKDSPVTLPPGCISVSTRPRETGSSTPTRTIGIVAFARVAASVADVPAVTRIVTPEPISSLTRAGSTSVRSSAQRSRTLRLLPSVQPSAERPSRNASRRRDSPVATPRGQGRCAGFRPWRRPGSRPLPSRRGAEGNRGVSFIQPVGAVLDGIHRRRTTGPSDAGAAIAANGPRRGSTWLMPRSSKFSMVWSGSTG